MSIPVRRSPLALTVLVLLVEGPMHAYRIQTLIKEYGKDRYVNVRQRASVYQTIERLLKAGLIKVRETGRVDNRPERTVYELDDGALDTARVWLREMLSITDSEFPEFVVGVSFLLLLEPADARRLLEVRAAALREQLAVVDSFLTDPGGPPRLFLLEEEYQRAVLTAQLGWLDSVVDDLRTGRLTWSEEWLRAMHGEFGSKPEEEP